MAEEEGPRRPEKVSKSDLANEIVEDLRNVARKIVKLGDAHALTEDKLVECERNRAMYEEDWHRIEDVKDEHECWAGLLQDFRLGIRDAEEVLAGTVGR
jgi:hypothetical protein